MNLLWEAMIVLQNENETLKLRDETTQIKLKQMEDKLKIIEENELQGIKRQNKQ